MSIINYIKSLFAPKIKNDIQIDLSNIEQPFKSFIESTIKEANSLGITVLLSSERQIVLDEEENTHCNGYFCDDEMLLAAACGQDFDAWFPVFIHESSHMDQWNEDDPTWMASAAELAGVETGLVLDLWLFNHVEATPEQLMKFLAPTREVELDCERRTIQKILDNNLPMDTSAYAQRANAYVWYYNIIGVVRKWYTIGKEPYNIPEIVSRMSTNLDGDYSVTPPEIEELFLQHMFSDFKR